MFLKGYGFLFFTKNMDKIVGKNISKNLSSKYGQKLFDHAKQFVTDALKTVSKRAIQKKKKKTTAEATGDLIYDKRANKIAKVSGISNRVVQRQLKVNQKRII